MKAPCMNGMKQGFLALLMALLICAGMPALAQTAATGSISGCAYVDENQNALCDGGEQLMTGVPVVLQRLEGDDWTPSAEATTDTYGRYAFEQLAQGTYRVVCALTPQSLYAASVGQSQAFEGGAVLGDGLTLTGSATALTADIGLRTPATLALSAYADANGNGERGNNEKGLAGVLVEVLANDDVIVSGTTNEQGELRLGVRPGKHALRVTLPGGHAFTYGEQSLIAQAEGGSATSAALTFAAGRETAAIVSARPAGSLSGMAFEDMNNNGILDEDEPGAAGITLHIAGKNSGITRSFITDETGLYSFDLLPDDNYTITADLPEGMLFARYSNTGGDLRSIFSGSTVSRNFPVRNAANVTGKHIGVVQNGVIRGVAFMDSNYNGVYDEGEPGYAGVTVEAIKLSNSESFGKVVTGEDGAFAIENLRGGEYRLRAVLPNDGSIFSVAGTGDFSRVNLFEQRGSRRENSIQPVTIESGGEASVVVGVARGATVSGVVFEDADYNGSLNGKEKTLSGIKVYAVDSQNNILATATTIASGAYTLSDLMPGSYTIQVQRRSGYGFTRLRPNEQGGSHITALVGEMGVTAPMDISMAQTVTGVNAGMLPAATVSGQLFHDLNDDGLLSEGETGMVNARVRLLSEDGEIDLMQAVQADGSYFFDGVMPGRYTLTYLLEEHCEMARVSEGGNSVPASGTQTTTAPFDVTMGEAHTLPPAGAVTLGSFEGYVFHDINGDGMPGQNEERMAGAMLSLTSADGMEYLTTSAADGSFSVLGLRPSDYQLSISLPDGYIFTASLTEDGLGLQAAGEQTLSCPWAALISREEKLIGAVRPASVSGVIWLDEDENGARGETELIMQGVPVELVNEATGAVVKRVSSGEAGFSFENVRPGTYTVRFTLPAQSSPANDNASTFALSGTVMSQSSVTVREGDAIRGLATGLVSTTSVAGVVRLDENGSRSPVSGVTVCLLDSQNTVVGTAVTGDDGAYRFDGLWPGDYRIQSSLPSGTVFVKPDDPNYRQGDSVISVTNGGTGISEAFPLHMAQHRLAENIILIKPARVGDLAWLDANGNGLLDGDEPAIPGVVVRLLQNGQAAYETTTDAYGYYLFENVYPGEYTLEATAYSELSPTMPVPGLRIISSCLVSGDGANAQSEPFSVISGSLNLDFDAGYVLREGQTLPLAITTPPGRDWSIANTDG